MDDHGAPPSVPGSRADAWHGIGGGADAESRKGAHQVVRDVDRLAFPGPGIGDDDPLGELPQTIHQAWSGGLAAGDVGEQTPATGEAPAQGRLRRPAGEEAGPGRRFRVDDSRGRRQGRRRGIADDEHPAAAGLAQGGDGGQGEDEVPESAPAEDCIHIAKAAEAA